jgi:hypothetical protein
VIGHGSEGATALFDMAGFVVRAYVVDVGEWWLQVETTADRVGCAGCGVRAVGHGRRRVEVRDLPIAGRPVRLVWAKRIWRCRILDEPQPVFAYRRHRGVPADPELARDLSDAVGVLTDPTADLDPSSSRERCPRSDLRVVFGPRCRRAQRLDAPRSPSACLRTRCRRNATREPPLRAVARSSRRRIRSRCRLHEAWLIKPHICAANSLPRCSSRRSHQTRIGCATMAVHSSN